METNGLTKYYTNRFSVKNKSKSEKPKSGRFFPELNRMPWILLGITFLLLLIAGIRYFHQTMKIITRPGNPRGYVLYIRTGAGFKDVLDSLQSGRILTDKKTFTWLAGRKNYPSHVHPGRYRIRSGMRNRDLVALLLSGRQEPVRVSVQNYRSVQEMALKLSRKLEPDSASWLHYFSDPRFLDKYKINQQNIFSLFIPDTYEFYWNVSPAEFMSKMDNARQHFWNQDRLKKAEQLDLTTPQVVVLASIVEKETNHNGEKSIIAGTYLNRLKINMPLQADPTVIFAWNDFTIRRVTGKHTALDSPYNTYKYTGLPPGPICLPSSTSIDAVLNPSNHHFLYFCANADLSGGHAFAVTLEEHQRNAKKYQAALDKRNIH